MRIHYTIDVSDPKDHLISVRIEIEGERLPNPLVMFMPVWTPGSYLVREYARHVEQVRSQGRAVRKVRKNAWAVPTDGARASVEYKVYANELTVRTNHIDARHAYWNGACTYLFPDDVPLFDARVTVVAPESWRIGTALQRSGHREYKASGIDELCDSPFECGEMVERSFTVFGKTHHIWVACTGHEAEANWDQLLRDTATIVETEATLMAGHRVPSEALPYDAYHFLWTVSPKGRGGLEHERCCSLLTPPSLFKSRSGYLEVLSLVAHEFLHLWNVKRIRPEGLSPYRYEDENLTRLLFWFEGGTSYFDWRVLRLANLATVREYADHLAEEIARVLTTPGALVHPLSEASFDAWVKAYRPDENSVNSTVSYYVKGEVVCALLDLVIRTRSVGEKSLDDVLRHMYWAYACKGRAVPEDGFVKIVREATGVDVSAEYETWVLSAAALDVEPIVREVGLTFERRPAKGPKSSLGVKTRTKGGRVYVDSVLRGQAAAKAGLDVGDELIALGGRRIEDNLDDVLGRLQPHETTLAIVARDGRVETFEITLDEAPLSEARLVACEQATQAQKALCARWLGEGAWDALCEKAR